jgi:hypothetical protein
LLHFKFPEETKIEKYVKWYIELRSREKKHGLLL